MAQPQFTVDIILTAIINRLHNKDKIRQKNKKGNLNRNVAF